MSECLPRCRLARQSAHVPKAGTAQQMAVRVCERILCWIFLPFCDVAMIRAWVASHPRPVWNWIRIMFRAFWVRSSVETHSLSAPWFPLESAWWWLCCWLPAQPRTKLWLRRCRRNLTLWRKQSLLEMIASTCAGGVVLNAGIGITPGWLRNTPNRNAIVSSPPAPANAWRTVLWLAQSHRTLSPMRHWGGEDSLKFCPICMQDHVSHVDAFAHRAAQVCGVPCVFERISSVSLLSTNPSSLGSWEV